MSKRDVKLDGTFNLNRISHGLAHPYSGFQSLNGWHPWQDTMPEGHILYPARKIKNGKVAYFNFQLAREMGLIPESHPHELNQVLQQTILDTFCIQIINEYDQSKGLKVPPEQMKDRPFMATRYLQLQHRNKRGVTSGDGRSIWNGIHQHQGRTWDVSSRGTGVTRLAPGAVLADKPLQSGSGEVGYGCGMADIDELVGSALMSEIFHQQGISTERMLTIIDIGNGLGIGVRAAPNLIRPAHMFMYLKQEQWQPLKRSVDFFLERQTENGTWDINLRSPNKYDLMLEKLAFDFANFTARIERDYVFLWLDWDGDNVLANAGIIDYGSVRQFGLRHDQYRYDDVDRFSTCLNEQKQKARDTIQVFAQLVDYLRTKKRRPLNAFKNHWSVKKFETCFETQIRYYFLQQLGFTAEQADFILKKNRRPVDRLYRSFMTLETCKTKTKLKAVADGVNRPAIFKMRAFLRELPGHLLNFASEQGATLNFKGFQKIEAEEFLMLTLSSHAKRADQKLSPSARKALENFQDEFLRLTEVVMRKQKISPRNSQAATLFLRGMNEVAQAENFEGRITGNSIEFLVEEILKASRKGMTTADLHQAFELFVQSQAPRHRFQSHQQEPMVRNGSAPNAKPVSLTSPVGRLYQNLVQIALEFEEDI